MPLSAPQRSVKTGLRPNLPGAGRHLPCMGTTAVAVGEVQVRSVGRDEEFAAFFAATWPRLFRTTYTVAQDRGAAEDALQAAFATAYARWSRIREVHSPEAYVRRMAVNEVLGVRRRTWWRAEHSHPDPQPPPSASHEDHADVRDAVWAAVAALPPRQRAVVVLRYYEGLSELEIAETLGCSRGTVKSQASDALRSLRQAHAADPTRLGDGGPA